MNGRISKRSTISRFVATCMAVAALASFAGCGSATGPDGVRVFGVVTLDGNGVGGVTISSADGAVARSADTGWYEIHLQPGSHKLEFAKDGHPAVYRDVTVDGAEVNMDVDLAGGGGGRGGGGGESFTCAPGVMAEYTITGPATVEFDVQGVYVGQAKEHIAWAYEPGDYWRGGVSGGLSQWGIRTNKIKTYGVGGRDAKEPRYEFNWDPSRTYHIAIRWDSNSVVVTVDGWYQFGVSGNFPLTYNVGIGWPTYRPGLDGARFSNIKWPAGAVLKMKTF